MISTSALDKTANEYQVNSFLIGMSLCLVKVIKRSVKQSNSVLKLKNKSDKHEAIITSVEAKIFEFFILSSNLKKLELNLLKMYCVSSGSA